VRKEKKINRKSAAAVLKNDRRLIDRALRKYLKALRGPVSIRQAMKYAVLSGGKRLRPILTLETARMLGGDVKNALDFACAVELVHNFSLVQDDLPAMDDDDTRRGKPACHRKFGEAAAILAGDGLLVMAYEILAKRKSKNALSGIRILSKSIGTDSMLGGQMLDLQYRDAGAENPALKLKLDGMKTAALMAVSCELGALAAGADRPGTRRARLFGRKLGLAFQLGDDIEDSGKSAASGKMKEKAKLFIKEAKKYIAPLGKKSEILTFMADLVLEKTLK